VLPDMERVYCIVELIDISTGCRGL